MSERIKKALMGLAALAALALGGGAIAQAGSSGGGDKAEQGEHGEQGDKAEEGHQDESASGPQADRAKAAALKITNGGTANSVERDDENGATWEVEVTKPDGQTVDVRLDQAYERVVVEGDSEDAGE
jgi:uncharacterized membrane protein YkoI